MQMHKGNPSVSYSFMMQLAYPNKVGMFALIVQTIGAAGGDMGPVDIVSADNKIMTRDITVQARDEEHVEEIVQCVRALSK